MASDVADALELSHCASSGVLESKEVAVSSSPCRPPLNIEGNEFRLLRFLLSEDRQAKINCELVAVCQADWEGRYVACSYVWGPASPTRNITVNGIVFTVRQNLFDFLSCLAAQATSHEWFWVDAICIDQTSIPERQHQVSMMHNIFADAAVVYSWLGTSMGMSRLFESVNDWIFTWDGEELTSMRERRFQVIKNTMSDLVALSRSAYWSRMWICQEFILNRHVRIFCGVSSVEYHCFQRYLDYFELIPHRPRLRDAFYSMVRTRYYRHYGPMNYYNPQTFEHYFDIFGHKSCRLLHDKVFALLGIVGDADSQLRNASLVNYSQSPWELLRKLLTCCTMETPLRLIKNFATRFALDLESLASSIHGAKVEAAVSSDRIALNLYRYPRDLRFSGLRHILNGTTHPFKEVEISLRAQYDTVDHGDVVTAFLPCGEAALDKLYLFKAGRIDDCNFRHNVSFVARKAYSESTLSWEYIIVGLGIYSTITDGFKSDYWKRLAIRKDLRKIASENLKRHFRWETLAALLHSLTGTSRIREQFNSEQTLRYTLETDYLQLLRLAAEVPGDLWPEPPNPD